MLHAQKDTARREVVTEEIDDLAEIHIHHGAKGHEGAESDACLDTLTIAGTPAECRARIAAYAGVVDELLLLNVLPSADGHALMAYQGLMGLPRALSAALRA